MATIASLAVKLTANATAFMRGLDDAAKRTRVLESAAAQVYEGTRTPLEKYRSAVQLLNEMKEKGLIDAETFARAVKQEQAEVRKAAEAVDEYGKLAKQIYNSTRTPLEKYQAQLKLLNDLKQRGKLDAETFARAVTAERAALHKAEEAANSYGATAKQIYNSTRTPLEKYQRAVKELSLLKQKGLIDAETFARALKKEKLELKDAESAAGGLAKTLKVGAAAVLAAGAGAAAGLLAWAKSASESIVETTRFARSLGATTQGLTALRHGAAQLGADVSAVNAGLKTLLEQIADAGHGGAIASDVFKRLGVNAHDLARLPVDQAFGRIAEQLSGIADPAKRAALATQLFGQNAGALLPLLSQGAGGIGKFADEAKRLGLSFDNLQGGKVEEAARAVESLKATLTGLGTQIAVHLAPWVTSLVDRIKELGGGSIDVGKVVTDAFRFMAKAVAYGVDAWNGLQRAVDFVTAGLTSALAIMAKGLTSFLIVLGKLPNKLGGQMFRNLAIEVQGYADAITATAQELNANLAKSAGDPSTVQRVDEFFDAIQAGATKAAKAAEGAKGAFDAVAEAAKQAKLAEESKGVIDSALSPLERFQQEVQKLDAMLAGNHIGWETYAKAVGKAVEALEAAHDLASVKMPSGLTRESGAARSAVVKAERTNEVRSRRNPQERLRRVIEESKRIEEQQLTTLKDIARELQKRTPKGVV